MEAALAFADAVLFLNAMDQATVTTLHAQLSTWGYAAAISAVGSKPGQYKCEYRRGKPARALCILRMDGAKWSVRVKLFHLDEYADALTELTEAARASLLASKSCVMDGGCKGPVSFVYAGQGCSLCRHSMLLRGLGEADLPGLMAILARENAYFG